MNHTQKYNLVKFAYQVFPRNYRPQGDKGQPYFRMVTPQTSTTDNYVNPFVPQQNKQIAPTTNNMISQWEAPRQNSNNKETSSNHDGQSSQLETPTTYGKHPFAEQNKQTAPTTENANKVPQLVNSVNKAPTTNNNTEYASHPFAEQNKQTAPTTENANNPLASLDRPSPIANNNPPEYPTNPGNPLSESFINSGNSPAPKKDRYDDMSYEQLSEIAGQRAKQMEQNNWDYGNRTLVADSN